MLSQTINLVDYIILPGQYLGHGVLPVMHFQRSNKKIETNFSGPLQIFFAKKVFGTKQEEFLIK